MNHVGFVAIEDYLANAASQAELEKCKALISTREAELAKKTEAPEVPITYRSNIKEI